ncbi:PREDICTED: uncharacterized protein LOC108781050 [Cyphomyrmex costatus]|uniref:uncharacterized protein LOC108781050 n=1 Tax=Cyphomyrmex costatus TaxID=456900 RepID=UPI0008523B61|nr:PREDICTED: uncharacterized protein LOC108781050 [Cyphomyrmex costatus]
MIIKQQTHELLKRGGFELTKWCSNEIKLRDSESPSDNKEFNATGSLGETRALGLVWNYDLDIFKFVDACKWTPLEKPTKRKILSRTALIFDPLGFVTPVTLTGKIIMQELWLLKIDWDESIPMELNTTWKEYESQIEQLDDVKVPRKILIEKPVRIELHGFADANQQAYGACVYVRSISESGQVESHLIASKSRIAPVKSLSIPRLELCGAVVLAQLINKLKNCLNCKIDNTVYWTDSSIVLCWLQSPGRNWTLFVANLENPADLLSRGATAHVISRSELWWYGPHWLKDAESEWPVTTISISKDIVPERRKTAVTNVAVPKPTFEIFERFLSYLKLIRVFAVCLRFVNMIRKKGVDSVETSQYCDNDRKFRPLSVSELEAAKLARSSILKLNPFLDANGILRVGDRLKDTNLSYNAKHPMLIPAQHRFTRAQLTLASIRQEFWPCSARNVVRQVINTCVICFRNSPKLSTALMGDLPEARVKGDTQPFETCGIDYAGPIYYKEGQRKNSRLIKCFIAIFVCFMTKAVHLELSNDLTSATFLSVLKRFIARRGRPNHTYSDNGLNCVGAERELKELFDSKETEQQIIDNMVNERIQWHFIPPRAPHMGGLWEAAVKSVKFHLARIAGEACLRHEELNTLLVQIEAILNSRPLTRYQQILTIYLIDGNVSNNCDNNFGDAGTTKEYLHVYQQWSKWNTVTNPIQIGQLVILKEDNLPPLSWKLGRIKEIYPGQDGIIRTALIHTAKGDYKRPITKLCVLPIT